MHLGAYLAHALLWHALGRLVGVLPWPLLGLAALLAAAVLLRRRRRRHPDRFITNR